MTVKEYIEALSKLPPDARLVAACGGDAPGYYDVTADFEKIEIVENYLIDSCYGGPHEDIDEVVIDFVDVSSMDAMTDEQITEYIESAKTSKCPKTIEVYTLG